MGYNNGSNSNLFLIGALMGGIIGSATGLLLAPKKGEDLRHDIVDRYNQLNDLKRNITNKARRMAHLSHEEEESSSKNFLLGSIAGSLIGATTAFLLAPKAGSQLRRDLSNKYSELAEHTHQFANDVGRKTKMFARNAETYSEDWKEIAGDVLDKITNSMSSSSRGRHLHKVDSMMDWLNIGVRLWQNIQKRR